VQRDEGGQPLVRNRRYLKPVELEQPSGGQPPQITQHFASHASAPRISASTTGAPPQPRLKMPKGKESKPASWRPWSRKIAPVSTSWRFTCPPLEFRSS
jgi:hypothetical protein